MKRVKIIFFDIDGTLFDLHTKIISEKTIETLKCLQSKGIKICIATGRAPISLPEFNEIEFDAYLTFNGSLCYDASRVIFNNPIKSRDVEQIIKNATDLGRPVAVATKDRLGANGEDEDLAEYYSFANQKLAVIEDYEEICKEHVYQLMIGCRKSDYAALLKDVIDARITAWWDHAVDIIPADGGKGKGVQKVLEAYGIDKSDALAFGDGDNDIEMLQAVGTGVAMGNASSRLKMIANEVCGCVSEDGIYYYCKKHHLI